MNEASMPEKVETTTFYLRHYLTPGGTKRYEDLPKQMQAALLAGKDVVLLSVPEFVIVTASALTLKQGYPRAWYAYRQFFLTAYEAIRGINGTRGPGRRSKRKPQVEGV